MSDERPGGRMTLHPAKRLITIDTETLLRLHKIALDLDENSGDRRGFDVLDSILAAWDAGITREDVEAVVGPDMEYVTGGCSCARCNAQRALYTAVAGAPQEAE